MRVRSLPSLAFYMSETATTELKILAAVTAKLNSQMLLSSHKTKIFRVSIFQKIPAVNALLPVPHMNLKLCEHTREGVSKACILFSICNFNFFLSKKTDLKVNRNWVKENRPIGVIFNFSPFGPKQMAFGLSFI